MAQYLREDAGAQSKKSYEHKYGSKVFSDCLFFPHISQGVKGSKAAKKGVKDETYLDEDEDDMNTGEDMKAESKGSSGGGRSAKVNFFPFKVSQFPHPHTIPRLQRRLFGQKRKTTSKCLSIYFLFRLCLS
jgi:hypothetical protein